VGLPRFLSGMEIGAAKPQTNVEVSHFSPSSFSPASF
jgi:hypothetical protein